MDKMLGRLQRWVETLLCLLMTCLVALAFIQVILRYAFNRSIFWAEEVILFTFTWIIFLAAGVNLARGAHFGVDVLVSRLPQGGRRLVQGLVQGAVGAILSVCIWAGFRFAVGSWVQVSEILRVPTTFLYLSLPVAACLMLLVVIRDLIVLLRGQPPAAEAEDRPAC